MSGTMKACVVQEGKTVKVEEKPIPGDLQENEVLFKVIAIGQSMYDPSA